MGLSLTKTNRRTKKAARNGHQHLNCRARGGCSPSQPSRSTVTKRFGVSALRGHCKRDTEIDISDPFRLESPASIGCYMSQFLAVLSFGCPSFSSPASFFSNNKAPFFSEQVGCRNFRIGYTDLLERDSAPSDVGYYYVISVS